MVVRRSVVLVALFLALFPGIFVTRTAEAAGFGRAGIVVVHGDGSVDTWCVPLFRARETGLQLLRHSPVRSKIAHFNFGHALCWLDGEGVKTRSTSRCFSDPGGNDWGYFTQNRGETAPTFSMIGFDQRVLRRGAIDYWVWGTFPQATPVAQQLSRICGG